MSKVLHVDDEPFMRNALRRGLGLRGHEVIGASDGGEGLEKALQEKFDLIICDVQMPQVDGPQMVRELRLKGYTGPIIFLSGETGIKGGIVQQMLDENVVQGFVAKPYNLGQLLELVGKITSKED